MRASLACFVTLLLLLWSSQVLAMQPRTYTDDEKEFFKNVYESCKQSVTAELSGKEFQKTLCFAHIKGSSEVATEMGMSVGLMVMAYTESCKELREGIKMMENQLCVPEKRTLYQFAKDYVAYVDSAEYQPYIPTILRHEGESPAEKKEIEAASRKYYQSPADLFRRIYACKRQQNAKPPDAKK